MKLFMHARVGNQCYNRLLMGWWGRNAKTLFSLPHCFTFWSMANPSLNMKHMKSYLISWIGRKFQNALNKFNRLGYGSTHAKHGFGCHNFCDYNYSIHLFDMWWGEYNWQPKLAINSCICGVGLAVQTIIFSLECVLVLMGTLNVKFGI